jgi:hypothetical protein
MEKEEQTTNSSMLPGDSAQIFFPNTPYFFAKSSVMENPSGDPVTQLHTLHLLVQIRGLRVMENHHDGSYHHGLPGSGVLNKHGDAEA